MTTRPVRLRPTLNNIKMSMGNHGPEAKRRRLGNNGINTNGNGGLKRTGAGPRTRGMIESTNDGDDGSNGPTEKLTSTEKSTSSSISMDVSRSEDKEDSSSDSSSSDSSDSSDSEDSSGKSDF